MDFPEPEENSSSHSALNEAPFHSVARYRECLKNHAAALGGNATDGCREFMPCGSGAGGSLKCSACGCHRNFHRKEAEGRQPHSSSYSFEQQRYYQPPLHLQGVIMPRPYAAVAPSRIQPHPGQPVEAVKKRVRTKFTAEQKEKMLGYAEKAGWRLPRQDDEGLLQQFCEETGVKRRVLKVWMHNNKHKHLASKNDAIDKNE